MLSQVRGRVSAVVKRERPKVCHGVDAEAGAHYRLRIVEGPIGEGDTGLKITFIGIAETLRQSILACRHILRARQRRGGSG